jgi:UDP:flavonoid glycosyltransferase YjiC (YdhE family)
MAHIGFLPVYAKGHMYPASSLALHLQQRGHRITFFCIADAAAFFQEYGLDSVVIGGASFPPGYVDQVFATLGKMKGQAGVLYTMKLFKNLIDMHFAELPEAIRNKRVERLHPPEILRLAWTRTCMNIVRPWTSPTHVCGS